MSLILPPPISYNKVPCLFREPRVCILSDEETHHILKDLTIVISTTMPGKFLGIYSRLKILVILKPPVTHKHYLDS
jgi:hypothetical protein